MRSVEDMISCCGVVLRFMEEVSGRIVMELKDGSLNVDAS